MFRKYDKIFATSFVLATCITIFLFFTNDNFLNGPLHVIRIF